MGDLDDLVDRLREALGVETDSALAAELGLERSTVAQWRRRGSLPKPYQAILDAHSVNKHRAQIRASRQKLYGDPAVMYLLRAALAIIPINKLEADFLSPGLLGDLREQVIANVGPVIREACNELFQRPYCTSEDEYDRLVELVFSPAYSRQIAVALSKPEFGWHI
jgi:hypothetical protein